MSLSRRKILGLVPASLAVPGILRAQCRGDHLVYPARTIRNRAPRTVVHPAPGPQLFVDDFLILEQQGLTRVTHTPRRLPSPVLGNGSGVWQPFVTVIRDPETQLFRMWYNAWAARPGQEAANYIAYAESTDGVEWRLPELGILGSNNLLMAIPGGYGVTLIDEGPAFGDSARRFKLAWWGRKKPDTDDDSGMYIAFSADGLRWKPYEKNPVLPNYPDESDSRFALGARDVLDVFYDPIDARYSVFVKTFAVPEDGLAPAPRAGKTLRRLVSFSTSQDFIHWETPFRVIVPDERDSGTLEFYAVGGTIARGGLLIGCPRMLRDDLPAEPSGAPDGIGYSTLVTSRDGEYWERHSDVFFERDPRPESWDRAMSWIGSQVIVGNELYLYFGGYMHGHKINSRTERQIGLAKLRRDGYVSRDALGPEPGVLLTPLLDPGRAGCLSINAEASRGEIRVQLRDRMGEVLRGFSFAQCAPVRGDGLAQQVQWPAAGTPAFGRGPVHLEFNLRGARIYGFEFV